MASGGAAAGGLIYVVDTSAFIDLAYNYQLERFPQVWERIESLIIAGRLTAPTEVLRELQPVDDELA